MGPQVIQCSSGDKLKYTARLSVMAKELTSHFDYVERHISINSQLISLLLKIEMESSVTTQELLVYKTEYVKTISKLLEIFIGTKEH